MQSRGNVKNLLANFNAAPVPQPGPPSPCPPPFQHRSRMNTHTKALPNSGADSCKPNPWADRKAVSRNVSSGVLKLGARFENVNDSEKTPVSKSPSPKPVVSKPPPSFIQPGFASGSSTPTVSKDSERPTFPKPSQLKPTGVSKLALNFTKPSLNTGSSTTTSTSGSSAERPIAITSSGSSVERPIAITSSGSSVERPITPAGSVRSVPEVTPKPKALVPVGQSQLQENVQESTQKYGVKKTLSSSKVSPFLRQQQATPSINKSVDFSAEGTTNVVKPSLSKVPSNPTPPKPPNIQTVFKQKPDATDGSAFKEKTTEDSVPKIKPLPNVFALGKCPTKPKRPPHVDLGKFTSVSKQATDLSPPSDVYVVPCESEEINTAAQEESYDDVGVMKPPQSHPGGIVQYPEEAGVDEDLYEDLEERWADNEQTDTKTAAKEEQRKCDKEEKRRLEQEKKEQKAREKKEREARKKFKLSGAVEVLQDATALVDCKGCRNELPLTQGETIEIIRMTDNPEGLWLARNSEGLYGYVKTSALEVVRNALKAQSARLPDGAGDVYDDVGAPDGASMKNISFPPSPAVGALPGNDDELYDDVSSQSFPPPPPPLPNHPVGKAEEIDGKKKKKLEKEEKEFRKKFKYDGDISVLYQVVVDPGLTTKKWAGKDLPLKPGEAIDVIVKPQDGKLIGRNKEGKFGYVCLDHIQQDTEIYDDIGEDCIYDN